MSIKLIRLTIEVKNPNIYSLYKLKSFVNIIDDKNIKFNLISKEYNTQYESNESNSIMKYIDCSMCKYYDISNNDINKK